MFRVSKTQISFGRETVRRGRKSVTGTKWSRLRAAKILVSCCAIWSLSPIFASSVRVSRQKLIIAVLSTRFAFPGQSGAFKTLEAKSHFQKARQAIEGDDWNGAVLELNRALRYEPSNPEILTQLGVAYGELHKWDQAVKLLRKAVALSPGSASA